MRLTSYRVDAAPQRNGDRNSLSGNLTAGLRSADAPPRTRGCEDARGRCPPAIARSADQHDDDGARPGVCGVGPASEGGLRGSHHLARQRDGPRWWRRRDAADAARLWERGRASRTGGSSSTVSPSSSPSPNGCTTFCTETQATAVRSATTSTPAYERVLATNIAEMVPLIDRRDIVVLHDPQAAGMVDAVRATGARVAWRCHIGRDTTNDQTDDGWAFLRPYIEPADAFVFSRREYAPDWVDQQRLVVIPPSIDPFSAKNRELDPRTVTRRPGDGRFGQRRDPDGPIHFERRDGCLWDRPSPCRRHRRRYAAALRRSARDPGQPVGPAQGHGRGPHGVRRRWQPTVPTTPTSCSPGRTSRRWPTTPRAPPCSPSAEHNGRTCPTEIRGRVHLASIPMDDVDENAIIINALQRHAYIVVQKSLVEGFGLTVTEAMWKARPVIASRVGGIQDQIVHERARSVGRTAGPRRLRRRHGAGCSRTTVSPTDWAPPATPRTGLLPRRPASHPIRRAPRRTQHLTTRLQPPFATRRCCRQCAPVEAGWALFDASTVSRRGPGNAASASVSPSSQQRPGPLRCHR